MKYSEIKISLKPFQELILTIPETQIQGSKVSKIILEELEKAYNDIAVLTEKNGELTHELYGKKKNNKNPDEDESNSSNSSNGRPTPRASDAKKKLAGSRLKKDVPPSGQVTEQTVKQKLPDGLVCNCCDKPLKDLGSTHKASETDYIPAQIIEREYDLHREVCECGEIDFVMPRPIRPLENRTYSAALLTKLIVDRYRLHLPVYRQMKQLSDMGMDISRNTVNEAVLASWEQLEPIAKRLWELNRVQEYRYLDESPICRVVDKKVSKKFYLWGMVTDLAITFELTEKRNQKEAKRISGTGGTVMTDGHNVYTDKTIDGKHANCLAHLAQQLFKAFKAFPFEADHAIDLISKIYDLDRKCKVEGLDAEATLKVRQEEIKPLMDELIEYLNGLEVPPRSSMGKAINYANRRWKKLCTFLSDAKLRLDNNLIESIFKDVKLGMKNSLFVQSDLGGKSLAGFYSLIATCELHGVNSSTYIEEVLARLAEGWPMSKLDELLPWNFKSNPKPKFDPTQRYIEDKIDPVWLIKHLNLKSKVRYDPRKWGECMGYPPDARPPTKLPLKTLLIVD